MRGRRQGGGVLLGVGAVAVVGAVALGACAHRPRHAPAAPEAWDYAIDTSGERWEVELCFAGAPPPSLVASAAAGRALVDPRDPVDGRPLPLARGSEATPRLDLRGLRGSCVAYGVALAEGRGGWDPLYRELGGDRLVANELWLWHPPLLAERPTNSTNPRIRAAFDLPPGERLASPWSPVAPEAESGRRLEVPPVALRWRSYTVVGRPEVTALEVAGAALQVVVVGGSLRQSPAGRERWLTAAGAAVAALFGEFPVPRLQVIVAPVAAGGEAPVLFGAADRGGPSVLLWVDAAVADDAFIGEWVAIHELLHLGIPFLAREDAWLAEGLVTYYTEVLRARTGLCTEAAAWEALVAGFARGARDLRPGHTLGSASAAMGRLRAYHWVYWGGAAFALLADLRLREVSGGRLTLDHAIRDLWRCCIGEARRWPAEELFEKLDAGYPAARISALAADHLKNSGFVGVTAALDRLGVRFVGGRWAPEEGAPLAVQRRALIAGMEEVVSGGDPRASSTEILGAGAP